MTDNIRFFPKLVVLICLLGFFVSEVAEAARISQVRGKNVLIELEGTPARPGDIFFVVNPQGQRQGVVRIGQVRGRQAVAQLGRGQAQAGWSLVAREGAAGPGKPPTQQQRAQGQPTPATPSTRATSPSPSPSMLFGLLLGYSLSSMTLDPDDAPEYSLDGGGLSVKGLLDYPIWGSIGLRATAGLQQLEADGTNSSDQDSSVSVNYLSAGFWGRFSMTQSNFRPWVGGGVNLLFPLGAETKNSIKQESIQTTSLFSVGGGLDFYLNPRLMLPIQFEYNLFPPTDAVKANMITVRFGVGYSF